MPRSLPPFSSFPSFGERQKVSPREWKTCIDLWLKLVGCYLQLPLDLFSLEISRNLSVSDFLISYTEEAATDLTITTEQEKHLKRDCFFLTHRILTQGTLIPPSLLHWRFLGNLTIVYGKASSFDALIGMIGDRIRLERLPQTQDGRKALIRTLEEIASGRVSLDVEKDLCRHAALLKVSRAYGYLLMVGSDVVDSLTEAWFKASVDLRKKIIVITYRAFSRLLDGDDPNISLLLDHLYSLRATNTAERSLLFELAGVGNFMRKLRGLALASNATRLQSFIAETERLGFVGGTKPKRHIRRKIDKGKSRDEYGHGAMGDVHIHKMSLITQIQDIFPELGSGFIVKLLDEYDDDFENVTANLLENSLPDHLRKADRSEIIKPPSNNHDEDLAPGLVPRSTPSLLPSRKNVFDHDEFDNLAVDTSKLHIGRKNPNMTADDLLADRSTAPNKAAILSALAAFDSDDDERDDTYDVEDVGRTVDSTIPGSDEIDADLLDKNEEALFAAYKMSPSTLGRDSNTRRNKARLALKSETGMTDEAIEGWAIMIGRDPRRLRRLDAKFSMYEGVQRELASTAYREGPAESGAEDSDGAGRGRGLSRGRGRGRGGRGRGGDVNGPASDRTTQVARQRKDAHKGSRANHDRRDQRARKVARGGFAV